MANSWFVGAIEECVWTLMSELFDVISTLYNYHEWQDRWYNFIYNLSTLLVLCDIKPILA